MNSNQLSPQVARQIQRLHQQHRDIMALPADQALEAILAAPQPLPLVHCFPAEDLYFLIHDLGVNDALPLLALASGRQWDFILDMEIWNRDRIRLDSLTDWIDSALNADPRRLVDWFAKTRTNTIEYYLFKTIDVFVREHDQDPSDFGDDCFTHDDVFYVRIRPLTAETDNPENEPYRHDVIYRFLERLSLWDPERYRNLLLEIVRVLPAQTEEELFRWRSVRMAEHGFLPFDEAIQAYRPLRPADIRPRTAAPPKTHSESAPGIPVVLLQAGLQEDQHLFVQALESLSVDIDMEFLQSEFAALGNQLIAARNETVRSREQLRQVVKTACAYLSIGLEVLIGHDRSDGRSHGAALLRRYHLAHIFRVGYGRVLELKWRVQKWRRHSWAQTAGLPLSFWGQDWLGVLGGLLIKTPRYYDDYRSGALYREFAALAEVLEAQAVWEQIRAMDHLLARLQIDFSRFELYGRLSYKNLLLTLWARHFLGLPDSLEALSPNAFGDFFGHLWSGRHRPRTVALDMRANFLQWLCTRSRLGAQALTRRLGPCLEALFADIETELGRVLKKDLDPRHIHLFIVGARNR